MLMYHVQVSGLGFSIHSAARFNLTREELQAEFVDKWERGETIVAGGKVFDPSDATIQIYEGEALSEVVRSSPVAWISVMESGRDVTDDFIKVVPGALRPSENEADVRDIDPRRVAVVHGRDGDAVEWLFSFLRALDLSPLEWTGLIKATGVGAPSNQTVVQQLFRQVAAVVVFFTPDEEARLHPQLTPEPDRRAEGTWRMQPRPNVFLEAGMALALHPERTILVELGAVDLPSDLHGMNTVRLSGAASQLHDLAQRLATANCAVNTEGSAWLSVEGLGQLAARTRAVAAQ